MNCHFQIVFPLIAFQIQEKGLGQNRRNTEFHKGILQPVTIPRSHTSTVPAK